MKKAKLWYVIADGGRARFIEQDDNGAFRTVLSFVAAELHERSHDLGRDRPTRVKESANVGASCRPAAPRSARGRQAGFRRAGRRENRGRAWRRSIRPPGAGRPAWGADRAQAEAVQADGPAGGQGPAKGPDQGAGPRPRRAPRSGASRPPVGPDLTSRLCHLTEREGGG